MTDKNEMTFTGNGQVVVALNEGRICKITKGAVVKRGDIPNDAFNALAIRPDFGGDLELYAASRSRKAMEVENELVKDEPKPVVPRVATGRKKIPKPAAAKPSPGAGGQNESE